MMAPVISRQEAAEQAQQAHDEKIKRIEGSFFEERVRRGGGGGGGGR